jgi:hypothetical protein
VIGRNVPISDMIGASLVRPPRHHVRRPFKPDVDLVIERCEVFRLCQKRAVFFTPLAPRLWKERRDQMGIANSAQRFAKAIAKAEQCSSTYGGGPDYIEGGRVRIASCGDQPSHDERRKPTDQQNCDAVNQ